MDKKYIQEVIHKYIKKYKMYKVPSCNTKKVYFVQTSYSRWAVKECLKIAICSDDPLTDIENFSNRVNEWSLMSKTEYARRIFSIAYDITTDILCEIQIPY